MLLFGNPDPNWAIGNAAAGATSAHHRPSAAAPPENGSEGEKKRCDGAHFSLQHSSPLRSLPSIENVKGVVERESERRAFAYTIT